MRITMKYIKITVFIFALFAIVPAMLLAQPVARVNINGKILGANKAPVKGAVISSPEEEDNEAISDETGSFFISMPLNASMAVTAKGYKTLYLSANASISEINLVDEDEIQEVNVAFRNVNRRDLMGNVSAVDVQSLLKKNYFVNTLDGMDALAPGFNGNSMWGMGGYLLLVDGVPRELGNVSPTEIDQISFLKDAASVALYGSRAAKGVISITTKRGTANQQQFDVRLNSGMNTPKGIPGYLGSAEYMSLYNEARQNDGLTKLYSDEEIYNYASGKNPYRFPSVDFYSSEYLKRMYNRTDATAEISGGNERARYYTNIGYQTNGSLLNFGEAVKNDRSDRFNIRGNIDVNINKYISATVDATAIFYTGRGVNANYWNSAATFRPNRVTPLIPLSYFEQEDSVSQVLINNSGNVIDGKYLLGGTQLDQTNPFAAIYAGGNNRFNSRQFQFNIGLNADLSRVLKGLSFHAKMAVDYSISYTLAYNNTFATYRPVWNNYSGEDLISSIEKFGQDATNGTQNVSGNFYRQTLAVNGQLNYVNTFKRKHNVSAMFIVNGFQQSESAVYHRVSNANLALQAGYNYDHKYYVDFSGAIIHSAKMPKANRRAFSPTVTLGWRLSEEKFLAGSSIVDELKLTASAGILHTDLDIASYYLYEGYYTGTGAWYGWKDGTGVQSTESRRGDNPSMVFPKREEVSVGFEGSFFKNFLRLNGSFFVNRITGNIIQSSVLYPSYFTTGWPESSFIPWVNYNNDKRVGLDFGASINKRVGSVDWVLGVTGTYYNTTATQRAENWENSYQERVNKSLDGVWGLQNLGFFKDQADITSSASQTFGQVKPGDIKYKDQNNDGVIDSRDEVYLGKGGWFGAPFTGGINITAKWKNLTVFALGIARFGGVAMKNNSYFWVDAEDKYSEVVRDRWTEATQNTAKYPRLTTFNSDNNYRSSDFWLYKTNRFDLGKVQISYDLTSVIKRKNVVKELGLYVSGFNLLTISKERKIMEMNIGSAPQTRLYNLGVKALF
jgi:TonB-linked SusC/RagA family outer membrane protein